MKLHELHKKYPQYKDDIVRDPRPTCVHCSGTGTVKTEHGMLPCVCVFKTLEHK